MYEYKVIRRYKPSGKDIDELLKKYSEDGWRYVGLDPCDGMVFEGWTEPPMLYEYGIPELKEAE